MLKVGQEVTAGVIKIDKADRRIGLSIKAANYSPEQLGPNRPSPTLSPGEDLVALQHAFDAADEAKQMIERNQVGLLCLLNIHWRAGNGHLFNTPVSNRFRQRVALSDPICSGAGPFVPPPTQARTPVRS